MNLQKQWNLFLWGVIGEVSAGARIPPRSIPIEGKTSCRRTSAAPSRKRDER
jgi:hypothetical protein